MNILKKKYSGLIDKEYEQLSKNFLSLLDNIKKNKKGKSITDSAETIMKGLDASLEMVSIFDDCKLSPRKNSLLLLMNYLVMGEAIYSELIQLISYILLENHHDIYNPFDMKFVKTYDRLEKIPLFLKLSFVNNHGFTNTLTGFDRQLRNCIAHSKYEIQEDGTIEYCDIKLTQKDMISKISKLKDMIVKTFIAFASAYITIYYT